MSNNASPWCFPAYAENNEIANYWYEWGWKNQKNVFLGRHCLKKL